MQSITLQTNDSIVSSGDFLGQIQFAASNELDAGASRYIIGRIYSEAEGSFTSLANPASLVFATSANDNLPASGKIKISHEGHILPLLDNAYDLGSPDLRFRDLYVTSEVTSPSGNFDSLFFNTTLADVDQVEGQLNWNDTLGTLDLGLTDTLTTHLGQDVYYRVINLSGGTIYKGQAVYAAGVNAGGQRIEIGKFVADGSIAEVRYIGLLAETLNQGDIGYVTHFGHVRKVDLRSSNTALNPNAETWAAGDILFPDPSTAGGLTKVPPQDTIYTAIVLTDGNNGELLVRITDPGHINDLHDVNMSGLVDNNLMVWNSGANYWEPSTNLTFNGSGLQVDDGHIIIDNINTDDPYIKLTGGTTGFLTHTGSALIAWDVSSNLVPKRLNFIIDGTIDSSPILQITSENKVGINKSDAGYELDVVGTGHFTGDLYVDQNVGINTTSPNATLHVYNSTPSGTIFNAEGTNGSLFSVVDNLSGVLMSVNTIAGLPVLEVNSDYSVTAGRFNQNDFVITSSGDIGMGIVAPSGKLHVVGEIYVDNLKLDGNTLSSTDSNGNIYITPNGTGGIGGGTNSTVSGPYNIVAGGKSNVSSGSRSTVSGGQNNCATNTYSTVSGGYTNNATGCASTVGGGRSNSACSICSTIGGGWLNTVTGAVSTILGGAKNSINVCYSTLSGGYCNSITGRFGSLVGGIFNCVPGYGSFIGGGRENSTNCTYSSIVGGCGNLSSALYNFIGGGYSNAVAGDYATIVNGAFNVASGDYSAVVAGSGNLASGPRSFVGGGQRNCATCYYATVGGGDNNGASGCVSTVGGGCGNRAQFHYAVVAGGFGNVATSYGGTIAGGYQNCAAAAYNFIGGGASNYTTGDHSVVAGGISNRATATRAFIGGGYSNCVNGSCSSVLGGCSNTSSGSYSAILGGKNNSDGGCSSVFILGTGITATSANTTYTQKLNVSHTIEPSGTLFNVEGSNGSLFSVVDNLSGVLMSVNNNAGLPVFEVYDDDSIVAGRFAQEDFILDTSGNIGIGTTPLTSTTKLTIQTSAIGDDPIRTYNSSGANTVQIGHLGDDNSYLALNTNTGAGSVILRTDGGNSYVLSGNFGIGTSSPSYKLHVAGAISALSNNVYAGGFSIYGDTNNKLTKSGNDFTLSAGQTTTDVHLGYYDGGTLNKVLTVDSSEDRVGILNTAPDYTLDVTGSGNFTGDLYAGGNLGVGTTSPSSKLHVMGGARLQGNATGTTWTSASPTLALKRDTDSPFISFHANAGSRIGYLQLHNTSDSTLSVQINQGLRFRTNNQDRLYIAADGDVGIGTTNPQYTLDVNGTSNLGGNVIVGGNLTVNGTTISTNVDTIEIQDPIITLGLTSGNIVTDDSYDRGVAMVTNDGTAFMGWDNSADKFVMLASGVATNGSGNYDAGIYGNLQIADLTASGATFDGNVGIGITSPSHKVEVDGNVAASGLYIKQANDTYRLIYSNALNDVLFNALHVKASYTVGVNGQRGSTQGMGYTNNDLGLYTLSNERIRITNGGNVGIGDSSPSYKLDVAGTTHITPTSATEALILKRSTGYASVKSAPNYHLILDSDGAYTSLNHYSSDDVILGYGGGNVGIGTATPSYKLDILGGSTSQATVARIKTAYSSLSNNNYALHVDSSSHTSNMTTAGAMAVDVYGGRAFTINGQGNIGIGTNTPTTLLDVSGVITANGGNSDQWNEAYDFIQASGLDGTGSASGVAFWTDSNTLSYDSGLIWDSTNNRLGIGTTAPTTKALVINGENQYAGLEIYKSGTGNKVIGLGTGASNPLYDHGILQLYDSSTEHIRLYTMGNSWINGGNLGVGTNSPTQKLDVRYPAGGGMALLKSTDTTDGLLFGDMAYSTSNGYQGMKHAAMTNANDYMILSQGTNTYISAGTGGSVIMNAGGNDGDSSLKLTSTEVVINDQGSSRDFRVESNSNANMLFVDGVSDLVGIGTGSPSNALHIKGANNQIRLEDSVGGSAVQIGIDGANSNFNLSWASSADRKINLLNNGAGNIFVGIGTSTPSTQLDVIGSGNFTGDVTIDGHLSAATKSFYIDHPTKEGKLQYGSLESPYHGIRLTGRGKIEGGKCVVELPDYVNALVHDDNNVNIQITNYKHSKTLYVNDIDISNNCFTVKCDSWFGNNGHEFFWSFTAVRKDVQELQVEC